MESRRVDTSSQCAIPALTLPGRRAYGIWRVAVDMTDRGAHGDA